MDLVSFVKKQFSQIGAILAGDAGNKCAFHGFSGMWELFFSELADVPLITGYNANVS